MIPPGRRRPPFVPLRVNHNGEQALNGRVAGFAGADADHAFQGIDEDLAVADVAGVGRVADEVDGFLGQIVGYDDLQFDLGVELHLVFDAAIRLHVAFLPAVAAHFADGESVDAEFVQGVFHFVQFERLDDGFDFFHGAPRGFAVWFGRRHSGQADNGVRGRPGTLRSSPGFTRRGMTRSRGTKALVGGFWWMDIFVLLPHPLRDAAIRALVRAGRPLSGRRGADAFRPALTPPCRWPGPVLQWLHDANIDRRRVRRPAACRLERPGPLRSGCVAADAAGTWLPVSRGRPWPGF